MRKSRFPPKTFYNIDHRWTLPIWWCLNLTIEIVAVYIFSSTTWCLGFSTWPLVHESSPMTTKSGYQGRWLLISIKNRIVTFKIKNNNLLNYTIFCWCFTSIWNFSFTEKVDSDSKHLRWISIHQRIRTRFGEYYT